MEIAIEWKNGLIEVVSTSGGETGLSSDVNASSRSGGRAMAVMARVRFDLFEAEGLRVDFWWYSNIRDHSTASTVMGKGDIGEGMPVANLNLEPSRVLRLLDADQLDDVVSITVDNRWRIRRYGDALVNETKLEDQCLYWLGREASDLSIVRRVTLLHETIRKAHPDWSDEEIAGSYGYPYRAWARIATDESGSSWEGSITDFRAIVERARADNPGASAAKVFAAINREADIVPWDEFLDAWDEVDKG